MWEDDTSNLNHPFLTRVSLNNLLITSSELHLVYQTFMCKQDNILKMYTDKMFFYDSFQYMETFCNEYLISSKERLVLVSFQLSQVNIILKLFFAPQLEPTLLQLCPFFSVTCRNYIQGHPQFSRYHLEIFVFLSLFCVLLISFYFRFERKTCHTWFLH